MQFDEEGRMVFPSIETISPSFSVHNDSVHAIKHFWNCLGLIIRKHLSNVSCDGIPFSNTRYFRNHSSFSSAKAAISCHVSALHMVATIAINIISKIFKGKNGRGAKPLRLALGSLIIQTKYQYSDRELVDQLTENPYYQYFIGLPGYQEEPPIDTSTLVLFRKRLKMDVIMEAK